MPRVASFLFLLTSLLLGLNAQASYTHAGSSLLGRTDHASGKHAFYHMDGNRNVTAMINSSQLIVAKYLYDPFGRTLSLSGPLAEANTYRFASQRYHANSGITLYLRRAYDPNLQRWLNQDPIREAGGMNLFGAFANSPLNAIDPDGRDNMYGYGSCAGQHAPVNFSFSMPVGGGPVESQAEGTDPLITFTGITIVNTVVNASPLPMVADAETVVDRDADPIDRISAGLDLGGRAILTAVGMSELFPRFPKAIKPPCPPKPPGWKPSWEEEISSRSNTGKAGGKSWRDDLGGEWHRHNPDKWHSDAHWDYNPWTQWNSQWQNIDDLGNQIPK